MLRVLGVLALLAVAGCKPNPKDFEVRRIRDDSAKVTCWVVIGSGAISCLPDSTPRGP